MLRDGTSEIWPESVDKIFADGAVIPSPCIISRSSYLFVCAGLRQYWESPWATYSRGRSRWRNQFLVDDLKEAGVERSKEQVASHIRVLRNMWEGEKGLYYHSDSLTMSRSPLHVIRVPTGCWRRRFFPGERLTRSSTQSLSHSSVRHAYEGRADGITITVRVSHTL